MKTLSLFVSFTLMITLFSPGVPARGASVEYKVISEGTPTTPVEIEISGIAPGANPFNHNSSQVVATITPEGKSSFKTSGYWHQEFVMANQGGVRGTMRIGNPSWRIRFASVSIGKHSISVSANIDGLKTIAPEFTLSTTYQVVDKVRTSGRSFIQGDKPFVPIAYNIAWANRFEEITKYEQWFSRASKAGVNVARVWMASWSLGIEWTDTGLGDYTKRLDRAWLLDQVFLIAAKYGIGIQLVLINHGAFSTSTNPEWYSNPYNSTNGGPISNAGEFATDPTAWLYWERRLHYIIARYNAYPSLFTWEWWNEVNYTPIASKDLVTWIKKSDQVLDEWDPYQTMTTNSWSSGASLENWDNLDYAVTHVYDPSDPIKSLSIQAEALRKAVPDKPILVGEMGSGTVTEDPFSDPRGLHLHNAQWAATFVGFAGPSSYWWWDIYVDPLGLWGHTKGLSQLVSGLDIATMKTDRVLGISQSTSLILSDTKTVLGWVRHNNFDRSAKTQLLLEAAIDSLKTKKKIKTTFADPTSKGGKLVLPVSTEGEYLVKTLHTFTGKVVSQKRTLSSNGFLTVLIPKFTGDIAFRADLVVGS